MESSKAAMWFTCVVFLCCICCDVFAAFHPATTVSSCFASCVCNNPAEVVCTADKTFAAQVNNFNQFLQNKSSELIPRVHLQTDDSSLPAFLPSLPTVRYLSLAGNKLSVVQSGVLRGMRLRELNLSHNEIRGIGDLAFHDLYSLGVLDLSHNLLTSVSKLVFAHLPSLKVLNLNGNRLLYFPLGAVSGVPQLEVLSLNDNRLSYLTPGSLQGLPSLRTLGLRNNSLWSLTVPVEEELPRLEQLDVSANPFHCSCAVTGLRSLVNSSHGVLVSADRMTCFTPLGSRGRPVANVLEGLGECQKPLSVLSFDSRSVLYLDDVRLSCDIQGDPDPAILWLTPWGHQFADPSHLPRLESVCESCRHRRTYSSRAITFESTVWVSGGGKSLHITNFRGLFNGNITCQAYNYLGNATAVRQVEVLSSIPDTFVDSLFMGAFSAGGFLCFGLLVGSVKLLVKAGRARFGKRRKVVRTPTTLLLSTREDASLPDDGSRCKDHSVNFSDDFDSSSGSPAALSPLTSPPELLTPNEGQGTPTGTGRATNILETMEEVRWRLLQGMGRRMKTVKRNVQSIRDTGRRNVQSIRESGSVYMQNIRETGSTAASKVKAGVVMGMVSVKSHVQSIKEFCGTGDMGTHTVSAVSVETNLDTDETKELVRSVTLV